jgi:hypothetical protein
MKFSSNLINAPETSIRQLSQQINHSVGTTSQDVTPRPTKSELRCAYYGRNKLTE